MDSGNRYRRVGVLLFAIALIAFGFALGTAVISSTAAETVSQPVQPLPVSAPQSLTADELALAQLYDSVSPSVVSINVAARRGNSPFFEDGTITGSGSGFVLDQQGHIVTNNHVVDGATRVEVNFLDGTIVTADIVGVDADSDLAVLRVDVPVEQLRPLPLGDSDQLVIGQTAVAVGSPFGQRWTMTRGIISALDRTISGLRNFSIGSVIQTDAAINPGNSGGPLFNLSGQVIGVNSQIISQDRSNSGIGFAIPSNLVRRVAAELIANGEVQYSYIGISGGEVTLSEMQALNLPNNTRGVVIDTILDGPASTAGLRNSDIIQAIDGFETPNMSALITYLASNTRPGQEVQLSVLRDGQLLDIPLTLTARP
ncbi:MAG: PDZ domain-containing protein [Chloroflexi bacterium]|nr:MAG: PDZ domain-containing protein [Chloroflexota bacterium]